MIEEKAETAREKAETAREKAETAQAKAETAQAKAETAREKAETAQAKQNVQIIGKVNEKMSDLTSRWDQLSYEQKTAIINEI